MRPFRAALGVGEGYRGEPENYRSDKCYNAIVKAILLGLALLLTSSASPDGKYFGGNHAVEPPDMPRQRALVTFRDGVQTLIVESVVKGDLEELAWVVPVPSEPIEVAVAAPGTVATLPAILAPEVIDANPLTSKFVVPLAIIILIYALIELRRGKTKPSQFVVGGLALTAIWGIVSMMFFPVFASAGISTIKGGEWTETEGLQSTAITGNKPSEVAEWLKDNGFRVPQKAESVIKDYIEDGWWFAVARVKGGTGEGSPQPLKVVFKSDAPIYPMRLTGVDLDSLYVDLCVIADKPTKVDGLRTWESRPWDAQDPPTRHPRLTELAWDGASVTRMAGEVSGRYLVKDMAISLTGRQGRLKVATAGAVWMRVVNWGSGALSLILLIVGTIAVAKAWPVKRFIFMGVIVPVAASLVAGTAANVVYPIVETQPYYLALERSEAKQMAIVAAMWADDIQNEETYKREAELISEKALWKWGKDVPGGVVREGDRIVAFDIEGDPTYFEIVEPDSQVGSLDDQ